MSSSITALIDSNKHMLITKNRPIYKKENYADIVQFLIDKDFFEYTSDCNIMLQVLLPYTDDNGKQVGKMKYMQLDDDLYKNKYRTTLPITTTLTKECGDVEMWFLFFNTTDSENIKLIKTDSVLLTINDSTNTSTSDLDDGNDEFDGLIALQKEVDSLKENKLDKYFDYNEEDSTIQFYVNGQPYGSPIKMDNEVSWQNWD